jgi:hypothetical protein
MINNIKKRLMTDVNYINNKFMYSELKILRILESTKP